MRKVRQFIIWGVALSLNSKQWVANLFNIFAILWQGATIFKNGAPLYKFWILVTGTYTRHFGMRHKGFAESCMCYGTPPSCHCNSVSGMPISCATAIWVLECSMRRAGKQAPCVGVTDMSLHNLFINVQILRYLWIFQILYINTWF